MSIDRFTVEPLPKKPSLEHQQRAAKQLLRAAWAGEAEALARVQAFHPRPPDSQRLKLHDTQLVIARGYGFDSWASMKRKIESLTKTPLERFDLAVRAGDAEAAREMLSRHTEVRESINLNRFDFDSPGIHQAKKCLPLVDVLLEFGADINARSTWWAGSFGILEWNLTLEEAQPLIERGAHVTPWAAAIFGMKQELVAFLDADPRLIHARGGDGKTLLHFASTREVIELLLDRGADIEARDADHNATPLQYLIADADLARLLISRGAKPDIFAAARLGDVVLAERCLEGSPDHIEARVNVPPFAGPGLHIYGWTLGFDLTPIDVARKFGNDAVTELLLSRAPAKARFLDALWWADAERARTELAANPSLVSGLDEGDRRLINSAAWWYRPAAVKLMLELGFDPHVRGAHESTVLDRACFHGYADIVEMILAHDPNPQLTERNEFGGQPLGTCIYGSINGWDTGYPRQHARTVELLVKAGAEVDAELVPCGNDEIDEVLRAWIRRLSAPTGK